jgi:SOS-response transcriptional repressor LexA
MYTENMSESGSTTYAILEAIGDWWADHRFGPTMDEINTEVGLSGPSAVHFHLKKLEADGLIARIPRKHRSIRLTHKGFRLIELMREFEKEDQ